MSEDKDPPQFNPDRPLQGILGKDEAKVAAPGDFVKKLRTTVFANSSILPRAASFAEAGRFSEGVEVIEEELRRRGILIEEDARQRTRGAEIRDGKEVMILEGGYGNWHPAKKLGR